MMKPEPELRDTFMIGAAADDRPAVQVVHEPWLITQKNNPVNPVLLTVGTAIMSTAPNCGCLVGWTTYLPSNPIHLGFIPRFAQTSAAKKVRTSSRSRERRMGGRLSRKAWP